MWYVLAVESDPWQQSLLISLFKRHEIAHVIAENPVDAIALIQRKAPEILLISGNLPTSETERLIKWIRANQSTQGVSIVATQSEAVVRPIAQRARRADLYLAQPFGSQDVMGAICCLLSKSRYARYPNPGAMLPSQLAF